MTIKHLVVSRGPPGSGKTTLTTQIASRYRNDGYVVDIVTTDDYWERPDGTYDWNYKLIKSAHEWNFKEFQACVAYTTRNIQDFPIYQEADEDTIVFVDNTNTMWKEFKRYVSYAVAHAWTWEMIEPTTSWKFDIDELFKRNTHNVPLQTIKAMVCRFQTKQEVLALTSENLRKSYKEIVGCDNEH